MHHATGPTNTQLCTALHNRTPSRLLHGGPVEFLPPFPLSLPPSLPVLPCLPALADHMQPNAEAQFLEVKNAFTVLSDPQQRAQYDRKMRVSVTQTPLLGQPAGGGVANLVLALPCGITAVLPQDQRAVLHNGSQGCFRSLFDVSPL